ncbi:MAG TPA: type I-E CRISPR-associated endonuclease Cas1e [Acidobacteriota bacterium]|nr:type I-E CRISPR-associated endonuclease Cas1e [Acidobacteriota bacterium]
MLKGRLGLEGGRIPHADRHGVMWLGRGNLTVESGTLRFITAGYGDLAAGDYAIPYQTVSCLVVQPGSTVSHDAMRILARHGCGVVFAGNDGVRFYASLPAGPDASARARRQALLWADEDQRIHLARRMYAWRLGEVVPHADLNTLRGIEGSRMKATYRRLAQQYGILWRGRRYDRGRPHSADLANQAINHASSAVEGAALTAVAATGAIPQLGFIHEDPGASFALDISDLFRDSVLLPVAFSSVRHIRKTQEGPVERVVRKTAGEAFRLEQVVTQMIDRIKDLLDDDRSDP